MAQGGLDQEGINIQREDVGPGELPGDEAMAVSLLRVLSCHLQEVVHSADTDLVWREMADIEERLELVLIEVDL